MRVEHNDVLTVVLSRRNLRALLAKLDGHPPWSLATLYAPTFYEPRVKVVAEEDEVHYAHESREDKRPGEMHPETEAVL